MRDYDAIIKEMEEYFVKYGCGKPVGYSLGFFDCLALVKTMREEDKMK